MSTSGLDEKVQALNRAIIDLMQQFTDETGLIVHIEIKPSYEGKVEDARRFVYQAALWIAGEAERV